MFTNLGGEKWRARYVMCCNSGAEIWYKIEVHVSLCHSYLEAILWVVVVCIRRLSSSVWCGHLEGRLRGWCFVACYSHGSGERRLPWEKHSGCFRCGDAIGDEQEAVADIVKVWQTQKLSVGSNAFADNSWFIDGCFLSWEIGRASCRERVC